MTTAKVVSTSLGSSNLQKALDFHQKGQLKEALKYYTLVLNSGSVPRVALLNTPPLLRALDRQEDAIRLSQKAISVYPFDAGIYNNLGNCYLDLDKDFDAIITYRKSLSIDPEFVDARLSLISLLLKNKFPQLAYATAMAGLKMANNPDKFIVPFLESYYRLPDDQRGSIDDFENLLHHLESHISGDADQISNVKTIVAQLWLQVGNLDKASNALADLRKYVSNMVGPGSGVKKSFVHLWNSLNWNLSILYLKAGRLKEGWSLYDHGLRVKADGPQRWQRSLKKPFGMGSIPLWRGEQLRGKSLLLLGEQGIGDTMMFATLIPRLIDYGAKIYFFPGDRLNLIYKDSMRGIEIISGADLKCGRFSYNDFDYQSPIGSICQYGFDEISHYAITSSPLKSNEKLTSKFRERYYSGKPVVGISWQGGGKPKRIKKKSCDLKDLLPILRRDDFTFVSLQYGNDGPIIERFNQKHDLNIIHDDDVDPIKDMYKWLAQVGAMDYVLSIANTTVHGSGGLGIPTLCLVSNDSDWRWIDPSIYKGNYWYESVDTEYQSSDGKWYDAISNANHWLSSRKPLL